MWRWWPKTVSMSVVVQLVCRGCNDTFMLTLEQYKAGARQPCGALRFHGIAQRSQARVGSCRHSNCVKLRTSSHYRTLLPLFTMVDCSQFASAHRITDPTYQIITFIIINLAMNVVEM